MEGPGLHYILPFPQHKRPNYAIQDVLRLETVEKEREDGTKVIKKPIPVVEYLSKGRADISEDVKRILQCDNAQLEINDNTKFLFYPASEDMGDKIALKGKHPEKMLKQTTEELLKEVDFVIIDGASGIRSSSIVPLPISNIVIVFFKYSKQHLQGTILLDGIFKRLKNPKKDKTKRKIDFKAKVVYVPTAIPDPTDVDQDTASAIAGAVDRFSLRTGLDEEEITRMRIEKISKLEWEEQIVVGDDTYYRTFLPVLKEICEEISD